MKVFDVTHFGAVGDGKTDNAKSIQAAIDQSSASGGGIVHFPGGNVFLTGPFDLKSNITFNIESSATILANPDESVYQKSAFRRNFKEGSIWIGGENAENVVIKGKGTIDGNSIAFMGPEKKAAFELKEIDQVDPRPHIFTPVNFTNLSLKDVTFVNAAYWAIHLVGCRDVHIEGIRIINNLKTRNSDGIDLDHSKNVRISNCYIESGDDCICFKTRREYAEMGPTENITVTNCVMKSTSCAIKFGSENMDAIRNVVISNCVIENSNRAIGIQNRDEGIIENILFKNIITEGRLFDDVWWGKAEPIYVTSYKRGNYDHRDANLRFAKGQKSGEVGKVQNIVFDSMLCTSENGIYVGGERGKLDNIRFQNVQLIINKTTKFEGGQYDLRPSDTEGIKKGKTSGFHLECSNDITIKDCSVKWGERRPAYFGKALFAKKVENLTIDGFSGKSADLTDDQPIETIDCKNLIFKKLDE